MTTRGHAPKDNTTLRAAFTIQNGDTAPRITVKKAVDYGIVSDMTVEDLMGCAVTISGFSITFDKRYTKISRSGDIYTCFVETKRFNTETGRTELIKLGTQDYSKDAPATQVLREILEILSVLTNERRP